LSDYQVRYAIVQVTRSYRYRIYPTQTQQQRLLAWEDACRFLWNLAHEQRLHCLSRIKSQRRYLTAFDQINELKALRAQSPWLADVPRNVLAQRLIVLDIAWQRCFNGLSQQPRWKKKDRDVLGLCEPHPKVWRLTTQGIVFPKLGSIPLVLHRPIGGTPKTCTIKRDGDQWFASISCEVTIRDPGLSSKSAVAIDRGISKLVADSNGQVIFNPRFLQGATQRLRRAQRAVSKKTKGSKNRKKASVRVARRFRKVRRQRAHLLHGISNHYAKNHGTVIIENLQIANMTASAAGTLEEPGTHVRQKSGLNRAILDASWGMFADMLAYKLEATGGRLVKVSAAYSSQTCAACFSIDYASRVSQSEFICTSCAHEDDADVNAAKVLFSRRADGGAVCGGYGFTRPTKQKLRVARRANRTVSAGGIEHISKAPAFRPV
jgi:putative transposase